MLFRVHISDKIFELFPFNLSVCFANKIAQVKTHVQLFTVTLKIIILGKKNVTNAYTKSASIQLRLLYMSDCHKNFNERCSLKCHITKLNIIDKKLLFAKIEKSKRERKEWLSEPETQTCRQI